MRNTSFVEAVIAIAIVAIALGTLAASCSQ